MKKMSLALSAVMLLGLGSKAAAQINDVTLTASPVAGYTWWDKNLNLGESPFWGARLGFAFGPILELRANYEKSYDLKGKLQGAGWSVLNNLGNQLEGSKVNVERIGGELKLNLWSGTIFTPYLTAGAGVLNFKYDDSQYKEEQLYAALGAGLKINFNPRVVLSLEGKNTLFNVNENNRYLAAGANPNNTLHNWGAQASLDFYLGGRKRGTDEVSRAYRAMYTDGFKGIKFVLEPGVAYLDFNKNSLFHDQWLVGGSAGVDFSSLLGVRGFYYAATEKPQTLNLKFRDDMKMYGANLIARLNQPRGVTPYLTLGGGYLDIKSDKYVDVNGMNDAKSGWFAMGGAGLEFPVAPFLSIYGNVNALLNEQDNPLPSKVLEPSQVQVNMMYQAGLRFNFGVRSRGGEKLYQSYVERSRLAEREVNMKALNELRANYDAQIADLNDQLATALLERDEAKVAAIVEEKKQVTEEKQQLTTHIAKEEAINEQLRQAVVAAPESKQVVMTRAQLEELVSRVVEKNKVQPEATKSDLNSLSDLDKVLLFSVLGNSNYRLPALQSNNQPTQTLNQVQPQVVAPSATNSAELSKVLDRTEELVRKVESLESKIKSTQDAVVRQQLIDATRGSNSSQPVQIIEMTDGSASNSGDREVRVHTLDDKRGLRTKAYDIKEDSFMKYTHTDVLLGVNMGDATTWNIGVRPNWQLGKSGFTLLPEFFYGFGSKSAWGVSGNVKYGLNFGAFEPYAGFGLGYTRIAGEGRLGTNIILGTTFKNVLGGNLFADYSLRPHFKNHQFSVGYSLKF